MQYQFKYDIDKLEELKSLNFHVYHRKEKLPYGYTKVAEYDNKDNGFYGYVAIKDKDLVVVFGGTNPTSVKDIANDIYMFNGSTPPQAMSAARFYDEVVNKSGFEGYRVLLTGYSLGGSLASYIGSKTNRDTVTFNPCGIGHVIQSEANTLGKEIEIFPNKIINYFNPNDILYSRKGIEEHIGHCYKIKGAATWKFAQKTSNKLNNGMLSHFEGGISDLKDRESFLIRERKNDAFYPGPEKKYTIKPKEHSNILYKKQAEYFSDTICQGTVEVSGYTRNDGTQIKGYVRKCRIHN